MYNEKNDALMEWDRIMVMGNKVYLCETKHNMTIEHINKLQTRLKEFPNKLLIMKNEKFKELMNKIYIGVAFASFFLPKLRLNSKNLGLIVVYPSGNWFTVNFSDAFN
ncbi:hypothetical protein C1645_698046 [Glomus cerebriforme]|uniref:Uncharacterized protein n=1 Tax=Glomus cerebriforme TaxID=658196 RepID=A0A397SG12_9GLOM|nr:hypothetical protein C1645_698046 [Glomus cerebriforme]